MLALALVASLALSAPPAKKTQLLLDIKPAEVVVFIDGKRRGRADKVKVVPVKAGMHLIKLQRGKDQHQEPVRVKDGESVRWEFAFEDASVDTPKDAGDSPTGKGGRGAKDDAKDAPAPETEKPASDNPGFDGLSDPDMN